MWYEILPGLGIMAGLLTLSGIICNQGEKLRHGGKLRRVIISRFQWDMKKRDDKLAGEWYKVKGLEYLPNKTP